jgi:Ca-activated chloride channel homolog
VAAAPEIAPVVQAVGEKWAKTAPASGGRCIAVDVTAVETADVAAAIAGQHGGSLDGVGQASGGTKVPDVWVADSSMWLQRLRALGKDVVPAQAPSIATSPVVLAMPEPVASQLGWPAKKLTWTDLLRKMTSDSTLRPGIVEPTRDAAGLSGLLALGGAAAAAGPSGQQATVAALRGLATGRSELRADLLRRFPRAANPATISTALSAAPLSEQAVIAYNASQPPVRLAAIFLEPPPIPLDYPYAVLPAVTGDKANAAAGLQSALSSISYRDRLGARGLRAPDGSAGNGFTPGPGAPPAVKPPAAMPDAASIEKVLSTWSVITLPARLLAVIDVSGSMKEKVPTAGNATREEVTVEAAKKGLTLLDDTWAVGLWIFSTLMDGAKDYKELVPIGPLTTQRGQLAAALPTIVPKPGGDTGLYDTTLAAYQTVKEGWDPGKVNSVVIFTDGKNDDPPGGLNLDQLLAELEKARDVTKPIQIIIVGIGPDVDAAALERITKPTGGGTFIATDPAKIGEIFLKAIALRGAKR